MYNAKTEIGVMAKSKESKIVMQISERALKFDGAKRETFLIRACRADPKLYKEVIALIQSINDSGSFMQLEIDETEL